MPKQFTIKQYVHAEPARAWDEFQHDGARFVFSNSGDLESIGYTFVTEVDVTFTIPDGFDIRKGAIERLEEEKKRTTADFQKRITEIDSQIAQFLAIEA